MARPKDSEYAAPGLNSYIALVKEESIGDIIIAHSKDIRDFFNSLPAEKAGYAYAPGKWTLQEVFQHVADSERIFTYRALAISRGDKTPLPGFDQEEYAAGMAANSRNMAFLKEEFSLLHASTDLFLLSLTPEQLDNTGTVNGYPISTRALVYLIYGHTLHHMAVVKERYL